MSYGCTLASLHSVAPRSEYITDIINISDKQDLTVAKAPGEAVRRADSQKLLSGYVKSVYLAYTGVYVC